MCHECRRKSAFSMAVLLATGVFGFAPDDNDPKSNAHELQALPDLARLMSIESQRNVAPELLSRELARNITNQLKVLHDDIGGARFANATLMALFLGEALAASAQLGGTVISAQAEAGIGPAQVWMEKFGNRLPVFEQEEGLDASDPDAVLGVVVDQLRKAGLSVDVLTPFGGLQRRDKPVGTGPNGEAH